MQAHSPVKGIVHRHPDRVLFKVVATCPVYCRFCFRREMVGPGKANALSPADLDAALAYIAAPSRNLGSDPDRRRSFYLQSAPHGARSPERWPQSRM